MQIFWIIIVSILMLTLFFGVTIAGGRAHDRQNSETARRQQRSELGDPNEG